MVSVMLKRVLTKVVEHNERVQWIKDLNQQYRDKFITRAEFIEQMRRAKRLI